MYGSLVFYNTRLLNTFNKLLQVHVFFRQLETLYGIVLLTVVVERAFPLLVPLEPTDEPCQLWSSVRLRRELSIFFNPQNVEYSASIHMW